MGGRPAVPAVYSLFIFDRQGHGVKTVKKSPMEQTSILTLLAEHDIGARALATCHQGVTYLRGTSPMSTAYPAKVTKHPH